MRERYAAAAAGLDERQRRMWAGGEALAYGRGGIAAAARVTGLARATVTKGMRAIELGETIEPGRVRRPGGGRRPLEDHNLTLVGDLERLVADEARGDCDALAWTTRSVRELAGALRDAGHEIHYTSVARYLRRLGFSMQSNRAPPASGRTFDRGEQFRLVDRQVSSALARGDPAISVEVRHRKPSRTPAAGGRVRARHRGLPAGGVCPAQDEALHRLGDYGVYDVTSDEGWVGVPVDADNTGFVVASIRCWWLHLGRKRCPQATTLTITAHCGAGGQLARAWTTELQGLADETGLAVRVCHFPPGTSRWNHVEHSLFSFGGRQRQGQSVISRKVVVSLIGSADSPVCGRVYARLDDGSYACAGRVSNGALSTIDSSCHNAGWNYEIAPQVTTRSEAC
jgi:transposase